MRQQKGAIAIFLTIFILSLMLVTSLIAAFLVLGQIQAGALIQDSIIAFYAAESGIEDALYQTKMRRYCLGDENTPSYECGAYNGEMYALKSLLSNPPHYTVQAKFIDYRTPYKITSRGFFAKTSRRVRTEPEFYVD